jgi:hypothetical protein
MTAAATELQRAIVTVLEDDAGLAGLLGGQKVYDHTPADVAFPYVSFGRTSVYDWSTDTETGSEQLFTIHAWSLHAGKREVLAIMEGVRGLLHDAALPVDGHRLVLLRQEFAEARFDPDQLVHHGLMRFRALLEPAG